MRKHYQLRSFTRRLETVAWRVVLLGIAVAINAVLFCYDLWEEFGHAAN
ncbi:hypothetical protein [Aquabacterium sp.]|nr:hypothetical protein [Aquabacterium sp.]